MSSQTIAILAPEIVLLAAAIGILVVGAFRQWPQLMRGVAGAALATAAIVLWRQQGATLAEGAVDIDGLSHFLRWLALTVGALLLCIVERPTPRAEQPEYIGSLLLAIAGLMLAVCAADMVLLFLALELISIPTYVLLYLGRPDPPAQEAGAKYFFLSVLASAMFLYGLCFLYGATGSTHIGIAGQSLHRLVESEGIVSLASGGWTLTLLRIGGVLVFAGLGLKIAAVPFHFYAPDVYQGTTNTNAALLSVVPKAAGLLAMLRLLSLAMPVELISAAHLWRVAAVLALLSMTVGNVLALWQESLRRLLAYSSIAHGGYMLIAVSVTMASGSGSDGWSALSALLLYLAVYAPATIGTFALLVHLGRAGQPIESVEELSGLGRTRPLYAAMLAVLLLSLTGIPPLAGFWGKLAVFATAVFADVGGQTGAGLWFRTLAVVGVLNAAIAAAYYLRIVGTMYFRAPLEAPKAQGGTGALLAAAVCTVMVLAIGIYPAPLIRAARQQASVVSPAVESENKKTAHQEASRCPHLRSSSAVSS